jgi:hypothetical protein
MLVRLREHSEARSGSARTRRGWALLAGLLLVGGLLGPDSLGPGHGNYLPQRIFLLGLAAVLPCLDLDPRHGAVRVVRAMLAMALIVQSAFVWDYALYSHRTAGALMEAKPFLGRGQRVGTLLVGIRGLYRANPLLHIDSALGVGTGNVIWSNYETTHYYFPVQLRDPAGHPDAAEFEAVAILDGPENAEVRLERWRRLVERFHSQIDVLIVWGSDPPLDTVNARWFEPWVRIGDVRVLRHRSEAPSTPGSRPPP